MPLLVVGSVALDCVETPTDKRDDVLGGSAVFFSYAASFFSRVRMIGAVGEDWPQQHTALLDRRGIDTSGIQAIAGEKTFRWRGRYLPNMNDRETIEVHLNVLEKFPQLPLSIPRQRFAEGATAGARSGKGSRTNRRRHHGPMDQYSAR